MICVLFSGGVDSWACLNWAVEKFGRANVQPIYYEFGQRCIDLEQRAASVLCRKLGLALNTISLPLLQEDETTGHVPLRNLIFLLLTAIPEDCEGVVFGMLHGDISEDKNFGFVRKVQGLLDSQFGASLYRKEGKKVKIYVPFGRKTKTQVVSWLLKSPSRATGLFNTVGCYSEQGNCGECFSCIYRWVAFSLNDISANSDSAYRIKHPFYSLVDHLTGKHRLTLSEGKSSLSLLWSLKGTLRKHWETYKAADEYSRQHEGKSFLKFLWEQKHV